MEYLDATNPGVSGCGSARNIRFKESLHVLAETLGTSRVCRSTPMDSGHCNLAFLATSWSVRFVRSHKGRIPFHTVQRSDTHRDSRTYRRRMDAWHLDI